MSQICGPFQRHIRYVLWCTNCFRVCHSYAEWFRHISERHMNHLHCKECNKTFSLLAESLRHIGMYHLDKRCRCDCCGHESYTEREFNAHDCEMTPYEQYEEDGHEFVFDEFGFVVG